MREHKTIIVIIQEEEEEEEEEEGIIMFVLNYKEEKHVRVQPLYDPQPVGFRREENRCDRKKNPWSQIEINQ